MRKKLYIQTHGCQMNVYDSQKIIDALEAKQPIERVSQPEDADFIVFNTCSVREKASEKLFSELGRIRQLKQARPDLMIAVGGCVASQEGRDLLKRAPYVDVVFGPQTLHRLPDLFRQVSLEKKSLVDVSFPAIEKFDNLPPPRAEGPSAYVSVMEGCSKHCSYCIVPYTRGPEISRPLDSVLSEVGQLLDQGVKEITLLGQNVNDYQGQTREGRLADLALLIQYIAAFDGVERIRFMTSHPKAFSQSLVHAYASVPQLVNHLHLPLQSGSNRILGLMKRGYTVSDYTAKIDALKAVRPDIALSTDIIIGFPGEKEDDFQATYDLYEAIGFDKAFIFLYSPRPGTPASRLHDPVPLKTKKVWFNRLDALSKSLTLKSHEAVLGQTVSVLCLKASGKQPNGLIGKTDKDHSVCVQAPESCIGQLIDVHVTAVGPHLLRGRCVADYADSV